MMFGPWEIPEGEYMETALRLERARKINSSYIGPVDAAAETVSIFGSDGFPYDVSMNACECVDFQRRGLPCKHMIRLALELGLSFDVPQFDPYSAINYDVEADIQRLTQRWQAGELTLDALSKCSAALRSSAAMAKRPRGRPRKK